MQRSDLKSVEEVKGASLYEDFWLPVNLPNLRYDEQDYFSNHEKKYKILAGVIDKLKPNKILDIGISAGYFYKLVPNFSSYEVHGVEIAPDFIKLANKRGIITKEANIQDGPLPYEDESFDFIICDSILEHSLKPRLLISEISRLLKPSGRFFLAVPNATSARLRWSQLRGRNIFEPLIDNLMNRDYLERCAVLYSPKDLSIVCKGYLTIDSISFLDETNHDVVAWSLKACRLLSNLKPQFRDVIMVEGHKQL